MPVDEEMRTRIVDVAAGLFAEHGYGGTKVGMVARKAGVTAHTVRRLTGGRAQLFQLVMSTKVTSTAAERLAAAASDPGAMPPLAVLLAAAEDVFADPPRSWDVLELEALTRAHLDPELLAIESQRMQRRRENTRSLVAQIRRAGGLDQDIDDETVVHYAMALSVGLAMLDPVLPDRPSLARWNALMARLGTALAPDELELEPEFVAGTRWRVRVDVPDRPGDLPRLTKALGALHVYTVALYVIGASDGYRTIDFFLMAPPSVTPEAIVAAAGSAGRNVYVRPGEDEDGLDIPTRVLDGATELLLNPGWAPMGAAMLAQAESVEVVDAIEGSDDATHVLRLQWTPTRHVVLRRSWAPFAKAERTRASALLRLAVAIAAQGGHEEAQGWVEQIKGGLVWMRLAHPEDADKVAEMHQRCSERTRYLRYVSTGEWRDVQLQRLAGGHRGATLIAINDKAAIVALGNVFPERSGDSRSAEIAIIVEDAYQGRGVGRRMLRRQIELAEQLGFSEVVAIVLAENTGMLRLLESTGLTWTSSIEGGLATWRAPIAGRGSEVRGASFGAATGEDGGDES